MVWSDVIANMLPADQQATLEKETKGDKRILRIASMLHDIGRGEYYLSKHTHGKEAATLLREGGVTKLKELFPYAFDMLDGLTEDQIEDISYLIENHHQFNHHAEGLRPDLAVALTVLQAADGLDLVRGNILLGGNIASAITERTNAIDNVIPIVKHTLRKVPQAYGLRTLASRIATRTSKAVRDNPAKNRFVAALDSAQTENVIN